MLNRRKSHAGRLSSKRIRSLARAQIAIFTAIAFTFTSVEAQPYRQPSDRLATASSHGTVQMPLNAMMPMPLIAPLFIVNQEFASTLVLVNGTGINTYADVSLRAPDGGEIVHQRVSFSPLSRQQVDVGALLVSAVSQHTYGSIVVNPAIPGSAIAAALSVTYIGGNAPNYIDEELAMPTPEGSQTLRAVADPGEGSPLIAVTSLVQSGQLVKINCLDSANHPFSRTIELAAQQTVLMEGCTGRTLQDGDIYTFLAAEQNNSYPATGISLTSDAMPGSYGAFALRSHRLKEGKYFSSMAFTDPKMLMSSNAVFTGVPVGLTTPLPGGEYIPEVSLANFSNRDANVTVRYAATLSGKADVNDVKSLQLPAGTSSTIILENLPGNPELKNSFVVVSDGAPGDVMSKLVSKSETAIREVELLGKDENDPNNGGNHPWSVEEQSESTLLLFNPSREIQKFTVAIQSGTLLWQKMFNIGPMKTESISIGNLIQGEIKDDNGIVLPKDLRSGQVGWRSPLSGKGRLLQWNRSLQMAKSFSCGTRYDVCGITNNSISNNITIGASDVPLGNVTPSICLGPSCNGPFVYPGDNGFYYSWQSSNTSIISIQSWTLLGSQDQVNVNGVAAGSATVEVYVSDGYGCSASAQGTGTCQVPTSIKFISVSVLPDGTSGAVGCPSSAWAGIKVDIKYQVLDQQSPAQAILSSNMTPHESGKLFSGTAYNNNIGPVTGYPTSGTTTASDGTFHDVPFGACVNATFSSVTATQNITMIIGTKSYAVRSQTWTVTGTTLAHGTVKNSITSPGTGSDVSASR